ncbi:MAG: STAS domain-containing protein [bacterium]|nr:STAS domain-containing protein [bacterium]
MNVERTDTGAVTVLRLEGDLDEHGVEVLRNKLYDCVCDGRHQLVLNVADVSFISYMAVGVLVERLGKARTLGGDMKLVGVNMYAERLFRMTGVKNFFDYCETEAHAVTRFQEAA